MARKRQARRASVSKDRTRQERVEACVRPTMQTAAKLRRDLVLNLFEQGRLRSEHVQAAEEIRRMWQAFSRILGPSAVSSESLASGRQSAAGRATVNWLSDVEEAIWRKRYRPWACEMAAGGCGGTVHVTRLQLVLDTVVDNRGLRQVEAFYRMRHGTAFLEVRAALHRYVEIAGWIDEINPSDGNHT